MLTLTLRNIERIFSYSWWIILFAISCYLLYEQGLVQRDRDFEKLHKHYLKLQNDYKQAATLQLMLQAQINSQSDLDWVELTLMKGLGLVPDGQKKVFFIRPNN